MSADKKTLEGKLREMYREIDKHNLDLALDYDDHKNAWVVKLSKGPHVLTTHLEKKDADDCLDGIECVYLGVQIGQFIQNFEAGS